MDETVAFGKDEDAKIRMKSVLQPTSSRVVSVRGEIYSRAMYVYIWKQMASQHISSVLLGGTHSGVLFNRSYAWVRGHPRPTRIPDSSFDMFLPNLFLRSI